MLPQTHVTTDALASVVSEKPMEEAGVQPAGSSESSEQPVKVEEIRTEDALVGEAQTKKLIAEKKEDPNPLLLDPYEFEQCTITVVYTRVGDQQVSVSVHNHKDEPIVKSFPLVEVPLPEQIAYVIEQLLEMWPDGKVSATMVLLPQEDESERKMVVSIRAGNDTPIVLAGLASEFPLPPPITALLKELEELLPARAMQKIENDAKARSKTNTRTTTVKATSSTPSKPGPIEVDGKTQMTLF